MRLRLLLLDVDRSLLELGEDADQVAESLTAEGCLGRRSDCADCPVAVYLARHWPGHGWQVLEERIYLTYQENEAERVTIYPPAPVTAFLRAFDRGRYPSLQKARPA